MRMFSLLMGGALFVLLTAVSPLAHAVDSAKDFSNGLTGMGTSPAGSPDSSRTEWQARQEATAAAAEAFKPNANSSVAPGHLAPGDKLKVTVFGEEDLSGEFEIDNTGSLALPLIGEVPASGLTPRELEKKITSTLESGYLVNPRVNIEVLNFRPFFILGEVNKPGSYPYVNDLTVINAVALGGGYTTRAKTGKVLIRRATDPERKEEWIAEDAKVYPGDVIRVEERFF